MGLSKLEKALVGVAAGIPLTEFFFFRNTAPNSPGLRALGTKEPVVNSSITPYLGNFPESFAIPAVSGFIGDYIMAVGQKKQNKLLTKIGEYLPEISTTAIFMYFSLGETVLPQVLQGRADIKDVPAVLISALSGYVIAKMSRKSGFNKKIYDFNKKYAPNISK